MFSIVKSLFWFIIGMLVTVLFFGVMLFVFGQSDHLECRHAGDGLVSCSVSHQLLGLVSLPGWQTSGINEAYVQEDCDDGCSYRTALRTPAGDSQPISEVWTDQHAQDVQLATQINAFIRNSEAPMLVIDQQPALWVIWLLAGLALMAVVIQSIVLIAQMARTLLGAGRSY